MKEQIEELVNRLKRIAEINDDNFSYCIEIDPRAGKHKQFEFVFLCQETEDFHHFVTGTGPTILDAVRKANDNVSAALSLWRYHE